MNEEKQAKALAAWLEQPERRSAPEDLDPEVLEAVYALRPELAPPPRVNAADILATVTAGPLAPHGGSVVDFPVSASAGSTSQESENLSSAIAANRPWWRVLAGGGMVGALAAAAVVLMVLSPALEQAKDMGLAPAKDKPRSSAKVEPIPVPEAAEPAEEAPPPPPALSQRRPKPAPSSSRSTRAVGAKKGLTEEPSQYRSEPARAARQESRVDLLAETDALASEPEAQVASRPASPNAPYYAQEAPSPAPEPEPDPEPAPPPEISQTWTSSESIGSADGTIAGGAANTGSSGGPGGAAPALADRVRDDAGEGYEVADLDDDFAFEQQSRPPRKKSAASNEPNLESEVDPADLDLARSDAMPDDLGGWRSSVDGVTLARIEEVRSAAEEHARAGRPAVAAETLMPIITPPVRAGQQAAVDATSYALKAGDLRGALELAGRGLALSSANTPERSMLLRLRGDVLRAMGDNDGAESAYAEAVRLNRLR